MSIASIICRWTGDDLSPRPAFRAECDAKLVIGADYQIDFLEDRSAKSMRFYFAALDDIFASLPEGEQVYVTREHMRHAALIECGFADKLVVACTSNADALRVVSYAVKRDPFAIGTVIDDVATVWNAQSQGMKAMGKDRFKASMDAVLAHCAALIGVEVDQLKQRSEHV